MITCMPVLVGTSGWQYASWRVEFYPPGLAQSRWLEHYAARFPTVENNSAFYRLPTREMFQAWRARTPDAFVMAVKASRFLTHVKRLREPAEPVHRLLDAVRGLGDRLGPVLVQLPPTMRVDLERLDAALALFPREIRVAVEPRHDSWWVEDVRTLLAARGCALCWSDRRGRARTPLWRTADWGYVRFHEGAAKPWPRYGEQALRSWAARIAGTWRAADTVYAYFNNDAGGAAVADALRLTELASHRAIGG